MTKYPFKFVNTEMIQTEDIYFIKNDELHVLRINGTFEKAIAGTKQALIHPYIKEVSNKFLDIKPDWDKVNSAIFIGNPFGRKQNDGTYLSARKLDMQAASETENNLVDVILNTAKYVYKHKKKL